MGQKRPNSEEFWFGSQFRFTQLLGTGESMAAEEVWWQQEWEWLPVHMALAKSQREQKYPSGL